MEKKADFKTMKKSEIIRFIWDYFKWHIIIAIILIASVISLIRHFATYQEPVAEIVLMNCSMMDVQVDPDFTDFMEQHGYDIKKEKVAVDTGYYVDLDANTSANMYTLQALQTLLAAGGVDVVAGTEEIYMYMGEHYMAANLEDYLSAEMLEKYADDIVYITDPETKEKYPGGIQIANNWWMTKYKYYSDDCIIGISNGCQKQEAAMNLFMYILGED